jgi:hypothetical protein
MWQSGARKKGGPWAEPLEPEFQTYRGMVDRCQNSKHMAYHRYGGRGIQVCDRWLGPNGYRNFLADMGRKPTVKHTIERIDNDGGYCPENCRWASRKEQGQNTPKAMIIVHDGKSMSMSAWAEHLGIPLARLRGRLRLGWSFDRIIATPQMHPKHPRKTSA